MALHKETLPIFYCFQDPPMILAEQLIYKNCTVEPVKVSEATCSNTTVFLMAGNHRDLLPGHTACPLIKQGP